MTINSTYNQAHPQVGILEWFHLNDFDHVKRTLEHLDKLGIRELRTGISWADYHTPEGANWYNWLIPKLASKVNILPCFLYTPPSMGLKPKTSSPPADPKAFADFIDLMIGKYGEYFNTVELWNEPNNRSEYDYILDTNWNIFSDMMIKAAYWAKKLGKRTVLGGMSPIDPNWLNLMGQKGVLQHFDAVGIHGFPEVFDSYWEGWQANVEKVREILRNYNPSAELWITETGFSTWQHDERKQMEAFIAAFKAPVERVYWYSLSDLSSSFPTVDGFHLDDREYFFGLVDEHQRPKLLYRLLTNGGIKNVLQHKWILDPRQDKKSMSIKKEKPVLVTGGAGFVGINVAHRLLAQGEDVIIYDNLSRAGVERNLNWLRKQPLKGNLQVEVADVRNKYKLTEVVDKVSHVFHFAAQVAVTNSLSDPAYDHQVNVDGTFNLLEAIRRSENRPSLIFTSTNKVYGNLDDVSIVKNSSRYHPEDTLIKAMGINESRSLDFHSPYGSSKGSADQYVLDYARSYGLQNVVFRMSCIYGPHQFGTEDQGWVAHFILKALRNEPITIFGDGLQVRDVLFVDDLVNAFMLARKNIETCAGNAFNIGGSAKNSISLIELIHLLEELQGREIPLSMEEWRTGDQKYYVSDISKFKSITGWQPNTDVRKGVAALHKWLSAEFNFPVPVREYA